MFPKILTTLCSTIFEIVTKHFHGTTVIAELSVPVPLSTGAGIYLTTANSKQQQGTRNKAEAELCSIDQIIIAKFMIGSK